jgi:hypothetical protein
VYAIFCAFQMRLHLRTDAEWSRLEKALEPDLFAPAIQADADTTHADPAPTPPPAPRHVHDLASVITTTVAQAHSHDDDLFAPIHID